MHPSISELIRSTLYPLLDDGGAVAQYPEVCGMKKRLFWLHHESPEDQATQLDPITSSRTNTFEVEMTVSLVQHLVRQGSYGSDDIAVITPYLGQLVRLRCEMETLFEISVSERDREELEALHANESADDNMAAQQHKPLAVKKTLLKSIRLATVDNFQGEEAKVVVISLVRSNDTNRCGFLSTPNRINVLLSRAKHGMYLIGNANTYGHVDMWAKVLDILEKNGNKGTELELQCERPLSLIILY
jgi:superfamily I DNA and/or RNA helicase